LYIFVEGQYGIALCSHWRHENNCGGNYWSVTIHNSTVAVEAIRYNDRNAKVCKNIRCSVPSATLQMLVVVLVHSRLDYGNGVMVNWPSSLRDMSTIVGSECVGSTGLPPEDPWPHNWCSDHSALLTGCRTNSVQAGCFGV